MTERVVEFKMHRPAVAVAFLCADAAPLDAYYSHLRWIGSPDYRSGYDAMLGREKVAVVHVARNETVRAFLELPRHIQFLIMVDDDMVVPDTLIDRWVERADMRLPFVSGYCTRKHYPFLPIPAKRRGMGLHQGREAHIYDPITNWPIGDGLHVADGVGMACVCIRRDVLEAIEPPWFLMEDGGGEDYYFCRKLQALRTPRFPEGVQVVVDTDTPIGHVGSLTAYPEHWFTSKDKWMADTGRSEVDLVASAAD